MTWQSPWSWLGLVTLALPILIHLLGRGRSRVQRFPTLRFIEASRLLPTRRTRLHDLLLLAVRLAILLAAVAALAQPLWRTTGRSRALDRTLARAIIVDTSASMRRLTANGESALAVARREATRLAAEADASVVLEASHVPAVLPGAVSWLKRQGGRSEALVISDFQVGTLDSSTVGAVPVDVGVRLVRIATVAVSAPLEIRSKLMDARVVLDTNTTDVTWTAHLLAPGGEALTLLAGPGEAADLLAASAAARSIGLPLDVDSSRAVALVYPGLADRNRLLARATTMREPWMTTLALHLRNDPLLQAASADAAPLIEAKTPPGLVTVRNTSGQPLAFAAQDSVNGRPRLLLVVQAGAGSALSAALIASASRGLSGEQEFGELEPRTMSEAALAAWQRPAASTGRAQPGTGDSDGRWLWLVALLLLGAETLLRRATPTTEAVGDVAA